MQATGETTIENMNRDASLAFTSKTKAMIKSLTGSESTDEENGSTDSGNNGSTDSGNNGSTENGGENQGGGTNTGGDGGGDDEEGDEN